MEMSPTSGGAKIIQAAGQDTDPFVGIFAAMRTRDYRSSFSTPRITGTRAKSAEVMRRRIYPKRFTAHFAGNESSVILFFRDGIDQQFGFPGYLPPQHLGMEFPDLGIILPHDGVTRIENQLGHIV